jgi:hypothetical protein
MHKTGPPGIIPVKIGTARRDNDAFSQMMFADEKHALDGEIIRLERCLATEETAAMFIWFVPPAVHASRQRLVTDSGDGTLPTA